MSTGSNTQIHPGAEVGTANKENTQMQVTPSIASTDKLSEKESCVFRKGGLCTTHNIVGTRSIRQTKSWKKKKNGTYGYITNKKVIYTCELEGWNDSLLDTGTADNSGPDGAANNGLKSNYISAGIPFNRSSLEMKNDSESPPPD